MSRDSGLTSGVLLGHQYFKSSPEEVNVHTGMETTVERNKTEGDKVIKLESQRAVLPQNTAHSRHWLECQRIQNYPSDAHLLDYAGTRRLLTDTQRHTDLLTYIYTDRHTQHAYIQTETHRHA